MTYAAYQLIVQKGKSWTGKRVLDSGCGDGALTWLLPKKGALVQIAVGAWLLPRLTGSLADNYLAVQAVRQIAQVSSAGYPRLLDPLWIADYCASKPQVDTDSVTSRMRSFPIFAWATPTGRLAWQAVMALGTCDKQAMATVAALPLPPETRPFARVWPGVVLWNLGRNQEAIRVWQPTGIT